MIDEQALQAAIPVGSNLANADLVRAIIEAYEAAKSAEPVAWVSQSHIDFLNEGRKANRPSSAIVHDRPDKEMGWTIALYTHPGAPNV